MSDLIMFLLFVFFCLGLLIGAVCTEKSDHTKAIAAGVAHYVVNPTTGTVMFRYMTRDEIAVEGARK